MEVDLSYKEVISFHQATAIIEHIVLLEFIFDKIYIARRNGPNQKWPSSTNAPFHAHPEQIPYRQHVAKLLILLSFRLTHT